MVVERHPVHAAGELYPTELRAAAVGWFFGIGRIGSFLAPAVGRPIQGLCAPCTSTKSE
jgi:hypothetical protein